MLLAALVDWVKKGFTTVCCHRKNERSTRNEAKETMIIILLCGEKVENEKFLMS